MDRRHYSELIISQFGKRFREIAIFVTKNLHLESGTIYLPRVDAVSNDSVTDSFPRFYRRTSQDDLA